MKTARTLEKQTRFLPVILPISLERMGAAGMTERLYECLVKVLPKEHFQHYISHSLKCTVLTHKHLRTFPGTE